MTDTSGPQRNYALAMGIVSDAQTDGEGLSRAMDRAKKTTLKGPPNQQQISLAQRWGIDLKENDTGWKLVKKLYPMIQARAFVYSVVRRLMGAKWQFYGESGLNEAWVDHVAKELISDPARNQFVMEMDNSVWGTKSDAWYRLGKRQWESETVQLVAKIARRDLSDLIQRAKHSKPPQQQLGKSKPLNARHTERRARSSGCSVILIFLTIIVSTGVFIFT